MHALILPPEFHRVYQKHHLPRASLYISLVSNEFQDMAFSFFKIFCRVRIPQPRIESGAQDGANGP